MMLTPEQLAAVAKINFGDAMAQSTVKKLLAHAEAQQARIADLEKDAARYRWLRKRHWSDSTLAVVAVPKRSVRLGEDCPSEERLDAAIDAAMQPTWPEDASDYGSRIAVIGQNGATGDHYPEQKP